MELSNVSVLPYVIFRVPAVDNLMSDMFRFQDKTRVIYLFCRCEMSPLIGTGNMTSVRLPFLSNTGEYS